MSLLRHDLPGRPAPQRLQPHGRGEAAAEDGADPGEPDGLPGLHHGAPAGEGEEEEEEEVGEVEGEEEEEEDVEGDEGEEEEDGEALEAGEGSAGRVENVGGLVARPAPGGGRGWITPEDLHLFRG